MELCKDHARERLNKSVERIAEDMGLADHWTLYKWFQTGRLPANLIRPYELACGINYLTRWIAASSGHLLVEIPTGRALRSSDVTELHGSFAEAVQLLTQVYDGQNTQAEAAVAALTEHMARVAWHHGNLGAHTNPQLEFDSEH